MQRRSASVQDVMAPVTIRDDKNPPNSGKRSSPQRYVSNIMKMQIEGDPRASHYQGDLDRFNTNFA